jgi:hypothetical protein
VAGSGSVGGMTTTDGRIRPTTQLDLYTVIWLVVSLPVGMIVALVAVPVIVVLPRLRRHLQDQPEGAP